MSKSINFLVTGGAGFIGTEVVRQLVKRGYYVRIADNLSKPGHQADFTKNVDFRRVDLTDYGATVKAFAGIDICINMAAKIGGIGYFHKYPATILSENNKIYSSTFEAAVKNKINRMVYISSSMVFESTTGFPSKEEDVIKIPVPITSYGLSKLVGEWYCKAFWEEYKLPFSICRPFNAYGINEFPGEEIGFAHVIPDLIKKIIKGQYPLEILGDGQQTRCFTHVADIADGIISVSLSEKGKNEDFNIANDQEITITDLAKKLWKICGKKESFKIKNVSGFKYDIKKRVPDVTKVKKLINWQSKIKLDDGLGEVVEWIKKKL